MLDGDPATGWSNYYLKPATATLHAVSVSRPSDWVSVTLPGPRTVTGLAVAFVTSTTLTLPAAVEVEWWDGHRFRPVRDQRVAWATASGRPTAITFDAVRTERVRLTMTSPTPGTSSGFLRIAELVVN
jgi:beta-galactosidase